MGGIWLRPWRLGRGPDSALDRQELSDRSVGSESWVLAARAAIGAGHIRELPTLHIKIGPMDESEFKQLSERFKKANSVITKLDPVLREDAWQIMRPYVDVGGSPGSGTDGVKTSKPKKDRPAKRPKEEQAETQPPLPPDPDEEELIDRFESNKDSVNLYLVLAIFYKRHGRGPISTRFLKGLAKALGLDIPKRPDKTFGSKTSVVRKLEDGWKVTPNGETWLQETYGVHRGKGPLPDQQ